MSNLNSRNFAAGSIVNYGPNLCTVVFVDGSTINIAPFPHQSLTRAISVHESEVDAAECCYYHRKEVEECDDKDLFDFMERDPGWQALKR